MNFFNRKNDDGIGGSLKGGKAIKYFPEDGKGKRLFLLFMSILMIGGVVGGGFYLIGSGENNSIYLMRPAIAEQLPVVTPQTQESMPIDVLAIGEDDDFAVPASDPSPLVAAPQEQLPLSLDEEVTVSDVAVESPPMPDESSLVEAVSDNLEEDPSDKKKEVVTDSVKSPQEDKPSLASGKEESTEPMSKEESVEPTSAEWAIVQNAVLLDSLSPPSSAGIGAFSGTVDDEAYKGLVVTDILSHPADIRTLPEKYLVVRKDHSAKDAISQLTAARTALSHGRYLAALGLFEELYKIGSWNENVSMGRAVALQKMGQIPLAMSAYEEIVERNPKNVEALTNMLGLLNKQEPDEAIERLLRLRDVSPFNADVTAQLGIVYGSVGDYENALKYLEMADALKPGNSNILYNRAVVYDRMGKTIKAADIYRQILLLAEDGILDRNFPVETVKNRLSVIR
ncbi:MAG: tetratricopeptide repeat protein [Alphaproteobacteria bacterium]|nr:tetratricopeptide repeat protein [Alphaproteobacteria bacterium]